MSSALSENAELISLLMARRSAGVLRANRGHVSNQAIDELVDTVREMMDKHLKGKATAAGSFEVKAKQ